MKSECMSPKSADLITLYTSHLLADKINMFSAGLEINGEMNKSTNRESAFIKPPHLISYKMFELVLLILTSRCESLKSENKKTSVW